MNAPVDVLAVMQRTCEGLHSIASGCSSKSNLSNPMRERAEEMDEARAAVAELIEAVNAALDHSDQVCIEQHKGMRDLDAAAHYLRLKDALARIGGAA